MCELGLIQSSRSTTQQLSGITNVTPTLQTQPHQYSLNVVCAECEQRSRFNFPGRHENKHITYAKSTYYVCRKHSDI